ncbi:hypothetical protein CICLE_v10018143mg [Citrus x clementina]|uniref:Uncharacterized protein n=1 Tax=Citrus clementina TaxID=85681 RepID=V4U5H2_CITCL|nr:hypothetical protein CICLE_v10018143mg [Citrus x clementina]
MAAETVTSVTQPITEKIVDVLFNPTVRQFGYLSLRTEAKKLTDRRNDLQAEIGAATRNGEAIKDEVQRWPDKVDEIIPTAENVLEDEVKVNKKCLGGLCVDLKSRYKLSREAEEKTLAISGLMADGNFGKDVSRPAPPPAIISSSEGFCAFRSRESAMKDIMEAMKNENVSIIGICGMGGVGKTTLVKEIQKQAKEMKMFDEVPMAVVSQTPSITKIQDEIAGWLGIKELPDNDELLRASLLCKRIEKQRVLVILDDNLLLRSEILALAEVNDLENIVSDLANDGFNELMFLVIFSCNEMKYLLNSLERTLRVTLHKFEWLFIRENQNFVEICHGQLPAGCLSNVKRLDVEDCGSMLKILPSHLVQSFQNLQRLRVESCDLLVSVFEIERVNIAKEETELFSSLEKLTLIGLPRMTDIWKGDTQFVSLRNLKKVRVQDCDELRQYFRQILGRKQQQRRWCRTGTEDIRFTFTPQPQPPLRLRVWETWFLLELTHVGNYDNSSQPPWSKAWCELKA